MKHFFQLILNFYYVFNKSERHGESEGLRLSLRFSGFGESELSVNALSGESNVPANTNPKLPKNSFRSISIIFDF
jgi:hypothetical protein